MRKKSAFLEKLTARAAAAFEAGSSFGAFDEHLEQENQEKRFAQNPVVGLSLHEPSVNVYTATTADTLASQAVELPVDLHDERPDGLPDVLPDGPQNQVIEQGLETGTPEPVLPSSPKSPNAPVPTDSPVAPDMTVATDITGATGAHSEVYDMPLIVTESVTDGPSHVGERSSVKDPDGLNPHELNTVRQGTLTHSTPAPQTGQTTQTLQTTLAGQTLQAQQAKPSQSSPEGDEERVCASLGFVAKALFAHLIAMEKNVLNMKKLCLYNQNSMRISYASIRTAWGRLKDLGIISHSARHDIGKEKGVLFQLNGQYTFAFQKLYGHMLVDVQAEQGAQINVQLGSHVYGQLGTEQTRQAQVQEDSFFDSSFNPNSRSNDHSQAKPLWETTSNLTSKPTSKPISKLDVHPDYNFWREHGLTQTQCTRWQEEFGLDELLLDNYLRWCAHDLGQGERKDKSGKTISNPANWFYSILKKTGSYPKPEGYQSHEEKTFMAREQALKDQADLQEREKALRSQEEKNEAEALFVAFLEEGEAGPYFHDICQKISPFLYENRHARRRLFENALRTAYFKFLGIDMTE